MRLSYSLLPALALTALSMGFTTANAVDSYEIDTVHTAAIFKIKHLGISNTIGRFNEISGTIAWDAANLAAAKIDVTIQAGSVDTHSEKRDAHLASPDFFDAKQFKTLKFTSSSFTKIDDSSYKVAGDFTMHGVTKPLTITAVKVGEGKDPWGGYRIGFESTFTIKRSEFGMTKMLDGISDDVIVTFSTEGEKK